MQERQETSLRPANPIVGHGTSNAVFGELSREEFDGLGGRLTRLRLAPGQILIEAGALVDHVFFFESGLTTLLAESENLSPSQLAMVGREGGMGLLELLTESRTAMATVVVQAGGSALRAPIGDVARAMQERPNLGDAVRKAVRGLVQQIMESAASNARDTLIQRCARWLVMAHERLDGDDVPITHDTLANMLGVRRSGVTVATASLQRRVLVQTGRGRIRVLDPQGLKTLAKIIPPQEKPDSLIFQTANLSYK